MKITQDEMDLLTELASSYDDIAYDPERHVLLSSLAEKWGIKRATAKARMDKIISGGAHWKEVKVIDGNSRWNIAYEKIE